MKDERMSKQELRKTIETLANKHGILSEEELYQARLDKINWDTEWNLPNGISIEWYIGTDKTRFYLCGDGKFSDNRREIQLDTVELLIRDLEANNDTK